MIELTTGVVFLMSSLYGSGQANSQMQAAVADAIPQTAQATTTAASSFSADAQAATRDPKVMEAYLREEFVDEPILVDIARCESDFKQFDGNGNLIRGQVDNDDVGVMQINQHYQGGTAEKLGLDLTTVEGNVAYAKHLFEAQGTQPWISSERCWSQAESIASK